MGSPVLRHFPTLTGLLSRMARALPWAIISTSRIRPRVPARWRSMVVVALGCGLVAAEPLGAWLIGRSGEFREKAQRYAWLERVSLDGVESDDRLEELLLEKARLASDRASAAHWLRQAEDFRDDVVRDHRLIAYAHYGRLRRKYERAASYPWLPVGPDPPVPGPLTDGPWLCADNRRGRMPQTGTVASESNHETSREPRWTAGTGSR